MTRPALAFAPPLFAALLTALAPASVRGEVIAESVEVEATGESRLGSRARERALDRAFVSAVEQVLTHLVSADTRKEREADLEEAIFRRARRYVDSFRVIDQREAEGRLWLKAEVRVVQRELVEAFDDLGIERHRGRGPNPGDYRTEGRPKLVLLLAASNGEHTTATFGSEGGDGGPAGRRFVRELKDRGFEVVDAAGESVPVSREAREGLLLSDEAAADLAARVGAGGAFVVGLEVAEAAPVRSTRLLGAESRASLRVIDASAPELVTQADVRGAGFGESLDDALARAAEDAVGQGVERVTPAIAEYWPPPAQMADAATVTIRGASSWGPVEAIAETIAGMPGVEKVSPVGFDRGDVILAVRTELPLDRIAAAARSTRLEGGRLLFQARGARELVIEVQDARTSSRLD